MGLCWEGLVLAFWWEEMRFSLSWAGLYEVVCFGVSAEDQVYAFVLPVVWVRPPAQHAASGWVTLGLGIRWRPLRGVLTI